MEGLNIPGPPGLSGSVGNEESSDRNIVARVPVTAQMFRYRVDYLCMRFGAWDSCWRLGEGELAFVRGCGTEATCAPLVYPSSIYIIVVGIGEGATARI